MGATLLKSKFEIPAHAKEAARFAILSWVKVLELSDGVAFPFSAFNDDKATPSLSEMFHAAGFDIYESESGAIIRIEQHDCATDTDRHEAMMASIQGLVAIGSYMVFYSDDEEIFGWFWDDDGFHVSSNGLVVFPDRVAHVLSSHMRQYLGLGVIPLKT